MPLSLSDFLKIDRSRLTALGCYNSILDSDSRFFINFMRLREATTAEFSNSYGRILDLFDKVGILLKASKGEGDRFYREAFDLLKMSEMEELCLGYSAKGTSGSGSGSRLKRKILLTGKDIISAGIIEPEIFELVGLFEDGIGPDRISDMIGRTIEDDLAAYSRRVLSQLDIPRSGRVKLRFEEGLLLNPFNNKQLLLIPGELLHELPIAREWEDIDIVCEINSKLREEINNVIGIRWKELSTATKKDIARRILLTHSDILLDLIKSYREARLDQYDFEADPLGEATWYQAATSLAGKFPLILARKDSTSIKGVINIVRTICLQYKSLIENNGLHEVLYYKGKPRHERIAQKIFLGVADIYCKANDLDLSPEVNSGRGSVDFKMSRGYKKRVVVEVKLTTNPQLIHGFETQTKEYQKAEQMAFAFYLVVHNGGPDSRLEKLFTTQNDLVQKKRSIPEIIVVDASMRASASKA